MSGSPTRHDGLPPPGRPPARLLPVLLLLILPVAAAGTAPDPATGRWRAADGPDTASLLELTPDGRFRYILAEGALDERAEGRWVRDDGIVRLFTEPAPTPPRIVAEALRPAAADAPLTVRVSGPGGQGIAGVEFRITFDQGPPVEGYTQYDGWTGDAADRRSPRQIRLHEPVYGIMSETVAVPPGVRQLRFRLEPNDLGIAAFRGTEVLVEGRRLTLRGRLGERHYARVGD
ncbi:MAG: hypothetical protein QM690_05560 [Sphingobium sp.]